MPPKWYAFFCESPYRHDAENDTSILFAYVACEGSLPLASQPIVPFLRVNTLTRLDAYMRDNKEIYLQGSSVLNLFDSKCFIFAIT